MTTNTQTNEQPAVEQPDYCTDPDNCRRCKTHPAHRGAIEHSGIGKRPSCLPAGDRAELIRRLRHIEGSTPAQLIADCERAAALLEASTPSDTPTNGVARTVSGKDADTAPVQRTALKPLLDFERRRIVQQFKGGNWTAGDIIDAVEAAHNIKEQS